MKTKQAAPQSIDEYIAGFPNDVKATLEKIRVAIRKAAPDAEETISYQMPTFTLKGHYLVYFAAYKKHIGFYPVPLGNAEFRKEMAVYAAGKGTLRFPLDKPIPFKLISKFVKFRIRKTWPEQQKERRNREPCLPFAVPFQLRNTIRRGGSLMTGQVLKGKVALVAGATRGAGRGVAVELGAAGATVYCTGRTTRTQPSELNRPETIAETAQLVQQAGEKTGGKGIGVQVDHLDPAQVQALVQRIESEQGRLDVLVNVVWGADFLIEWNVPVWEHSLERGLHMLRLAIDTHIITSHFALPLLIKNPGGLVVEMTDGTAEYNNAKYRVSMFYDLAKTSVIRMAWAQAQELRPHQCTAVALTAGWLRSEQMLDHYGVTEAHWRDAIAKQPHFVITETPRYVGRAVVHLAGDTQVARWSGQSLSSGQLAKVYGFTDLDGSQPDAWRYVVEVQDAGKPADATGYR